MKFKELNGWVEDSSFISLGIETLKQKIMSTEKDLNYWKSNAEEDYNQVPISVLRYITELETVVKNLSIPDVLGSAYFAAKGMNEVIVLAENISDAMDKLEESEKDYKLITAKSYEVIK